MRHAPAGERAAWRGNDRARPLSGMGLAQAEGLVAALTGQLRDRRLTQVLSSPYLRCTQTVAPLASASGLEVTADDALAEGAPDAAIELVHSLCGQTAVLCTHGDIIPEVLSALSADGLVLPTEPRWPKGSTWVLQATGERFTTAAYIPPPKA